MMLPSKSLDELVKVSVSPISALVLLTLNEASGSSFGPLITVTVE